jgi:hypothetical protein
LVCVIFMGFFFVLGCLIFFAFIFFFFFCPIVLQLVNVLKKEDVGVLVFKTDFCVFHNMFFRGGHPVCVPALSIQHPAGRV